MLPSGYLEDVPDSLMYLWNLRLGTRTEQTSSVPPSITLKSFLCRLSSYMDVICFLSDIITTAPKEQQIIELSKVQQGHSLRSMLPITSDYIQYALKSRKPVAFDTEQQNRISEASDCLCCCLTAAGRLSSAGEPTCTGNRSLQFKFGWTF